MSKRIVNFYLDEDLAEGLKILAGAQGLKTSELLRSLIYAFLANQYSPMEWPYEVSEFVRNLRNPRVNHPFFTDVEGRPNLKVFVERKP